MHTDDAVLDAYLAASASLLSLLRVGSVLRAFRPRLDLCKDTADSDGLHPSSAAAPSAPAFAHLCNPFPRGSLWHLAARINDRLRHAPSVQLQQSAREVGDKCQGDFQHEGEETQQEHSMNICTKQRSHTIKITPRDRGWIYTHTHTCASSAANEDNK